MENLVTVARQVAILFVLMGFGAAMRKAKFFKDNAIDGIVNVLILVVTPCLIIDVFQRPFDPSMLKGLGIAFALAVSIHIALIVAVRAVVRHRNEDVRRPLLLAAVFSNAGFMGIPLSQALLGDVGVFYSVVYVSVFNVVVWSWGVSAIRNAPLRSLSWTELRPMVANPGTLGLAFGLPFFFMSLRLPDALGLPVRFLADLNTPLAMIVIGYYLAGARLGRMLRVGAAYQAAAFRLLGCPLTLVAALWALKSPLHLDHAMMIALVVSSAAPTAALPAMFAARYGSDVSTSVGMVSGTTLLSIVTMPLVVALALAIL